MMAAQYNRIIPLPIRASLSPARRAETSAGSVTAHPIGWLVEDHLR
jgi:hypothetical protein